MELTLFHTETKPLLLLVAQSNLIRSVIIKEKLSN